MDKIKARINSFLKQRNKPSKEEPPPPKSPQDKSQDKIMNFVKYVFMLIIGYKLYYFNLNLEYYFRKIDYNKTKNIFLTGGSLNKISKETFESMFGSEINETLTENLKHTYENWFDKYVFNLKLDFSYYFLKLMSMVNKFKLTRYFVVSLLIGGFLYTSIMALMGVITSFFSVYGLLRVFTMELPFYIFAGLVPFFLMPFISGLTIFYYTLKLLFLDTKLPNNTDKPNIKGIDLDKLVIMSLVIIYISSRIPHLSDTFKYVKIALTLLSLLLPLIFTWKYDFFFVKDKELIKAFLSRNKGNMMYLALFIGCIILFSKYS